MVSSHMCDRTRSQRASAPFTLVWCVLVLVCAIVRIVRGEKPCPAPDCAEEDFGDHADKEQVGQHLDGHDNPGRLGLGHDVSEADSGEDGDCEIYGVDAADVLVEAARVGLLNHDISRGKEENQQRKADGGCFDASSRGYDELATAVICHTTIAV